MKRVARGLCRSSWVLGVTLALMLSACDDNTGNGNGDDVCTGFNCGADVKDTSTTDTTTTDTAVDTETPDTTTTCTVGESLCSGANLLVCVNGLFEEQLCVGGVCDPTTKSCVSAVCPVPNQAFACENGTTERICGADQLSFTTHACENGETCVGMQCGNTVCVPGHKRCKTANEVEECDANGGGYVVVETCGASTTCGGSGVCTSLCELNAKTSSFLGCEYYVVDLDNAAEGNPIPTDDQPFGITVSNPHDTLSAAVTVTGGGQTKTATLPPGEVRLIELASTTDVDNAGLHNNATFHLVSSIPVTAHQFNPLNGVGVFSNDASLLLPVNALGYTYTALNWPTSDPTRSHPEVYIDVVATVDGTQLTITSPITIPGNGSFTTMNPGQPSQIAMNAGQLLHLLSGSTKGLDISGLTIDSTQPIAVFAGTRCMITGVDCCCDHTEQQLFPRETWGMDYIAAKSFPRGTEVDHWRIIAASDNTTVTLTPPTAGLTTFTLNAGEVKNIATASDFQVHGDKPILVGQFWASSNDPGIPPSPLCEYPVDIAQLGTCDAFTCSLFGGDRCEGTACVKTCSNEAACDALCAGDAGCMDSIRCGSGGFCIAGSGIGDPAFSLAVPNEQFRADYIVLTPIGYQENYLTVIALRGATPRIDGVPVTDAPTNATPTPLNTNWDIFRFRVNEGPHLLYDNSAFGVIAYGYNCDVSYAYPGGLNLQVLN